MKRVLLAGLALASIFLPTSTIIAVGQVRSDNGTRRTQSADSAWVPENTAAQPLPFSQNWSNAGLITADNNWTIVPGIVGYAGADPNATGSGIDPQTITADFSSAATIVKANQANPNTNTAGGIAEFAITDPVVALQASGSVNAPHLVLSLDTTGGTNIVASYNLRDIDGAADNAVQPVALQYRVGNSGAYTNIPAGFVPDASNGPSDATLVTPVSVTLPAACENQSLVQLRIITTNAAGSDEWIGVDDISVAAGGGTSVPSGNGAANPGNPNPGDAVVLTVAVTAGSNPTSSNLSVVTDLTSIGGTDAQIFYDDATHGDVTSGDKLFSFQITVSGGTSPGIKLLPFHVADAEERDSTGNIQLTVQGFSNPSGTGSASPNPTVPGNAAVLTFTVVPGTGPPSTNITVTGDLRNIGGSATQSFAPNGANTFTFTATVPAGTPDGLKDLPITIQDFQGRVVTDQHIYLTVQANISHAPGEHSVMGLPSPATTDINNPHNYLVSRNQYLLSYDRDKGIPNWVAWHLDNSWIGGSGRSGNFAPDTSLPQAWQIQPSDYDGGFDRGHNCPSGDRTISNADNSPTFLMDNMIPQASDNNQGPWAAMENELRTMLNTKELYIFMGNAGQGGTGSSGGVTMTIGNGKVVVPAYTWKVVMALPIGSNDLSRVDASTQVFAVIMPNRQGIRADAWQKYLATVDQVEALTGYDFFSNVPVATQAVIESRIDPPTNIAPQSINAGTFTNLNVDGPNTNLNGDITVNGILTLGGSTLHTNGHKITLGPNATVSRLSGMIDGVVTKQFSATGLYPIPVGTAPFEYSPVTVDVTAVTNPSTLTVTPHNVTHLSSPDPGFTLKRFWTLTETGNLTAKLVFKYVDTDIPAGVSESTLALHKYDTSFVLVDGAVLDTSANTATTPPVSVFSDWTLMRPLGFATNLTVTGRVTNPHRGGVGVRGALVTFIDSQSGAIRTTRTDASGAYSFDSITSGTTFNASVQARGLIFTSRQIVVNTSLANEDFVAQ